MIGSARILVPFYVASASSIFDIKDLRFYPVLPIRRHANCELVKSCLRHRQEYFMLRTGIGTSNREDFVFLFVCVEDGRLLW